MNDYTVDRAFYENKRVCYLCGYKPERHMLMYHIKNAYYLCLDCHRYFIIGIDKDCDFKAHSNNYKILKSLKSVIFHE